MTSFLRILILCCFPFTCFSQLCTGSLGDPVVNITFGAGSNPGGNLGSVTNYGYSSTACPNDGNYTVVNSTSGCFNFTWHNLSEDHTPNDVNGYFMLVNSSVTPGDFYVSTVNNLCGGTTYEFAAWIVNVLQSSACSGNGTKPNVTFKIETTGGQVLQSFSTGDIVAASSFPQWKQYGFYFKTPANTTSVVIRMTNNAPGGCGNDLALDDITFRPCGAKVDVNVLNYGTQKNIVLCETGTAQSFTMQSSLSAGLVNPAYQWQRSSDGISFTDISNATGSSLTVNLSQASDNYYRVSIGEANNISQSACRTSSELIHIKVAALPGLNLADTIDACVSDTLQLTVLNSASQTWTGPNGFSSTQSSILFPNIQSGNSGKYFLTAVSPESCASTDSVLISVHPLPVVTAMNDTIACTGKTIQLSGQATFGNLTWTLNGNVVGAGTVLNTVINQSSVFILTAKDNYGCSDADAVHVTAVNSPAVNAGTDKEIMQGDSVVLNGTASGDSIMLAWSPTYVMQNSTTLTPTVFPQQDTYFSLSATSLVGCGTATDEVFVKVYRKIHPPNVFSPNADGINDTWVIDGLQTYPEAGVQVYNRYGAKVFETIRGYANAWNGNSLNGKILPAGIYFYVIDTKKTGKYTGWVMILK